MPRKPRISSCSGIYHIILRSINQQQLFEEEEDYLKFIYVLFDVKSKFPFEIYAYCLMGNHVHLLMANCDTPLSTIFQSIGARFVHWYNIKYHRFGHLFQDRFFSKPIETDEYFLSVLHYIHENPVRAGMCPFATAYHWSSCKAYYGEKNFLITKEPAIKIAGSFESLQQYFYANTSQPLTSRLSETIRFSDFDAMQIITIISDATNPSDFQHMPKIERNNYICRFAKEGLSSAQIVRLCGISRTVVYRLLKNET